MLEYDRIDISEGIDFNKTSASKECHFWYISKDDVISIMNNSNLTDKMGVLYFFLTIYEK